MVKVPASAQYLVAACLLRLAIVKTRKYSELAKQPRGKRAKTIRFNNSRYIANEKLARRRRWIRPKRARIDAL